MPYNYRNGILLDGPKSEPSNRITIAGNTTGRLPLHIAPSEYKIWHETIGYEGKGKNRKPIIQHHKDPIYNFLLSATFIGIGYFNG
jgi:hypothetical protein